MILTDADIAAAATVASHNADSLGLTTPCDRGHVLQRERLALYAERCCKAMPGDLIEIGSYSGMTSALLADIARKHGRTLVCIDDFMPRKGFDHTWAAQEFQKVLLRNGDVIEWHGLDAHSLAAVQKIQGHRYCFVFCDDGHEAAEHAMELLTLLPVTDGIICCDDCYLPHVIPAIRIVMDLYPDWEIIHDARLSECYLQRRAK